MLKLFSTSAFLSGIILLLSSASALALNSDREQPIKIKADAAVVDEVTGITIYTGRVTIDQGTLHIAADEVKVIMNNRQVMQIIASMAKDSNKLAHYEQQPDTDESYVYADAKSITYFLQEERLHLVGDAQLKQTNDQFNGELLHYDMVKRVVELKSSGKKNDRVEITLEPQTATP